MDGLARRAGTALVTGASTGIGYELAVVFARTGCRIVAVARGRAPVSRSAPRCWMTQPGRME
jgi:short-subunit dehydrogenase